MADISKITVGSTTYNLKDTTARNSITWQTPKRFVNATGTIGEEKTNLDTSSYLLFGATRSGSARMSIGTGGYPTATSTALTSTQNVSLSTGYDNGTTSYIDKFLFNVAGRTNGTLTGASTHSMGGSGYTGTSGGGSTIALGGLL